MTVGSIESGIRLFVNDALAADNTVSIFSLDATQNLSGKRFNVNKSYQGSPENIQNILRDY